MQFIDSHAHLNDPAFDKDREHLLTCILPQAGIQTSIEIGCSPDEWAPALALAHRYPAGVYAVLGVHPEYAPQFTAAHLPRLTRLVQDRACVAVGEIGLDDTCLPQSPRETQQALFAQLLKLAGQTRLPVVLHVRRAETDFAAYNDCFALLKQHGPASTRTGVAGVLHCFCARYDEGKRALEHGLLLGINGCFTYKKNEYIREAVKKVGARHIVLETDCPYLSPQGKRGQRNDPSNIPLVAQFVADYLQMPPEKLAEITTQNTKKLYGLP